MNVDIEEIKALPTLMAWRKEVIENVFGIVPSKRLLAANRAYYRQHIADGSHIAVMARRDNENAGCGAICLTDELPSPDNPSGRCAYLMNIYVRSQYRGQGIGHAIVNRLVTMARQLNCGKIWLETTHDASSLYHSVGFRTLPGIMKYEYSQNRES